MKKTRRFAAIAAAAMMTAALAVPMMGMHAFAEGEEAAKITISDSQEDAAQNYSAYQLLTATVNSEAGAYTYKLNDKYTTILQDATRKTTEDEILKAIGVYNAEDLDAFADQVYRAIKGAGITADATTANGTFESVAQGYYLIAQNIGTAGTATRVIVDTKGDTELKVTTKKNLPSFTKEIGDINDSEKTASADWNAADYTWGTDADHDKFAKDEVPFRLTATLPDDYARYEHYTLDFHDDLQKDVFGEATIKAVYVADADGAKVADITAYEMAGGCGTTHGAAHADGCDFTVLIKDLKTACVAEAGNKVVVEYTAPFTDETIVGAEGNWNTGTLEYSNNPYNSGYGEEDDTHSKTPEVNVVAFTYQTVINKVDQKGDALAGAEFTLEKVLADGIKKLITVVKPDESTFKFEGLDDGTYVLSETEVPDGYNGIEPIEFTVEANHDGKTLTTLQGNPTEDGAIELTATLATGVLAANVENHSGSILPSTGGIGTALFYVVGGVLVVGAGVTLITKKRVGKDAE